MNLHSDDIGSLAMHPSGTLVATGQFGRKPSIQVWSCVWHADGGGSHLQVRVTPDKLMS